MLPPPKRKRVGVDDASLSLDGVALKKNCSTLRGRRAEEEEERGDTDIESHSEICSISYQILSPVAARAWVIIKYVNSPETAAPLVA